MCGIAGMVSTGNSDADLIVRMCDTLAHRGPDGAGYHRSSHAVLGMRRLAIIDVAGGQQPVYNEDRSVTAVFNGEIYNYNELRAELIRRGHRFNSDGDSECLVHLYEEFGDQLVDHLRGMFAFAIWDSKKERLLLARDRIGKKPLYWRYDGRSLFFASELKSLVLDPGLSRRLDLVAVHHYLTYQYVPAPWSIYEGVQKVPPAHVLIWQGGIPNIRRYWQLDCGERKVLSEADAAEQLRELLLEATRIRMISERPLGAFLSGGIDSAAVVAAMARSSSQPVRTFTIGFENGHFDERSYARAVASHYGTDHHEMVVTSSALDILPSLAWHYDEPFADSSAIPTFYVARMSAEHVTVVLTGDGGDESFGGYSRYLMMARLGALPIPAAIQYGLSRVGARVEATRFGRRRQVARLGRGLAALGQMPSRRYADFMSYFMPEQKIGLYTDDLRAELAGVDSYLLVEDAFRTSKASSAVTRAMDVDVNTYLPGDILAKVDIATMANSLEARSPFLDQHLMEWAAALPADLKVRGGTTKVLLKEAIRPWLPPELLVRRKQGFGVPMAAWLRKEFRDLARDVLTDGTARTRGLFRPESVATLLDEHDRGRDHSSRLWALIQFELWHRTYLDASSMNDDSAAHQISSISIRRPR